MAPVKKRNQPSEDREYQQEPQAQKKRMTNPTRTGSGRNVQKVMAQNIKAATVGAHQTLPSIKGQGRGRPAKQPTTPPTPPREVIDLSEEEEPSVQEQERELGSTKKLVAPCNAFPRFRGEDVAIILSVTTPKFNYQFNSVILSQHSKWFRETLSHEIEEYDPAKAAGLKNATGLVHLYELEYNPDAKFWLLVKACITVPKSVRDSIDATVAYQAQAKANAYSNRHSAPQSTPDAAELTPFPARTAENLATRTFEATQGGEPDAPGLSRKIEDEKTTSAKEGNEDAAKAERQEDEERQEHINKPKVSERLDQNEESSRPSADTTTQTSEPKTLIREPTKFECSEAHNNLFLTYYSKTPDIDTTNIQKALSQSELLLSIASYYGSLPTVRLHITNILTQYGRELYIAILRNPPRWLYLSTYLDSAPIFRESLIHIVGSYPNWPWTVPKSKLTPELLEIIRTKVDELQILRAEVNEALFVSTLSVAGQEVALGVENKEVLDTWCTVQLWRDWFCRALNQGKVSRPTTKSFDFDAAIYRTMAKGGDAYLPLAAVKHWREEYDVTKLDCAKWTAEDLEEDLAILKDYAQKKVHPLLVNHSMLLVVEEGINYLTCTKVGNDELPWVKKAVATPSL